MPVPLHIRNAPTTLTRDLGYGKDYKYPHDYAGFFVEEEYLPENLKEKIYYQPSDQGFERDQEAIGTLEKRERRIGPSVLPLPI